jgi:UDP-N-acetyl-D-glucosamine dehydrogenase
MTASGSSNPLHAALLERIRRKDAKVGVIGLGYVGLPLAVEFARQVPRHRFRRRSASNGRSTKAGAIRRTEAELGAAVKAGKLRATTDMSELAAMDVVDIAVPTPLRKTKDPDLSYVVQAVEACAATLRPGQLVVLESTTYPGTTDEVVQPMLENRGLKADVEFFLAFSPERVDPGNQQFHTRNIPKIVGGIGPEH